MKSQLHTLGVENLCWKLLIELESITCKASALLLLFLQGPRLSPSLNLSFFPFKSLNLCFSLSLFSIFSLPDSFTFIFQFFVNKGKGYRKSTVNEFNLNLVETYASVRSCYHHHLTIHLRAAFNLFNHY